MLKDGSIICENCGKELEFVYVDGYAFGDKLMEGVLFKVSLSEEGWLCLGLKAAEDSKYMEQFNWSYWKSSCLEYCKTVDFVECPICGEEEVLVEES